MARSTARTTGARNAMTRVASVFCTLLLSGCGFVHDEKLVARYQLVAVDANNEMSLCWHLDNGNCVGDGLGGPTLFAAGYNDKFVVEAVHPESNRSRTVYYYILRDQK